MLLVNLPQNRCTDRIADSASASVACWRRDMVSVLRNESEAAKAWDGKSQAVRFGRFLRFIRPAADKFRTLQLRASDFQSKFPKS